jgi:plasmid stabilization system protein ParE
MSVEFDKEAKQEYLDAIRFYGKAAERFSDALATCIQKIQESPTRFRQIAPNIRPAEWRNFLTSFFLRPKKNEYTLLQSSTIAGRQITGDTEYPKIVDIPTRCENANRDMSHA